MAEINISVGDEKKNLQVKKAAARRMMPKRRPKTRPRIPPRPILASAGAAVTQARRGTREAGGNFERILDRNVSPSPSSTRVSAAPGSTTAGNWCEGLGHNSHCHHV